VSDLIQRAQTFAFEIQDLVNRTICTGFQLETRQVDAANAVQIVTVAPGKPSAISVSHPIERSKAVNGERVLGFKVSYTVDLDPNSHHLRVKTSQASVTLIQENQRPLIRLEYERGQGIEPGELALRAHTRHAAHVQIHGTSADLSYIWGLNGRHTKRTLEALHIPVGGRRYRPSIEDFIEFLYLEKLVTGLKPGGQDAIDEGRLRWFEIQLASTIRSNPEFAIQTLKSMGAL
jgi:hypothetical protein